MKKVIILFIITLMFPFVGTIVDVIWVTFGIALITIGCIAIANAKDRKDNGKEYVSVIGGGTMFITIGAIALIIFLSFY
jgi:hypothetical protein